MASLKIAYATSTALTCTLANLGTGAARISDAQDNSAGLYVDAMVSVQLCLTTGAATGNDNAVYVFLYGSEDGTRYTDNGTGVDAAHTLRDPHGFPMGTVVSFATATGAPVSNGIIGSVANCFGGVMPRKWGIVVYNKTNGSLNTATTMTSTYTPVYYTSS